MTPVNELTQSGGAAVSTATQAAFQGRTRFKTGGVKTGGVMRRVVCLVLFGMVFATGVAYAASPKDSAKGSGKVLTGSINEQTFSFNAWSDAANNDPQGTMKFEFRDVTYYLDVTCLAVLGSNAAIVGDITRTGGTGTPLAGVDAFRFEVSDTDNAVPSTPERFAAFILADSVRAGQCAAGGGGIFPLDQGDITVIDQ